MGAVADFFGAASQKIPADKVQGLNAVFQFKITGDGGGNWNVRIANGQVEVAEGEADAPSITLGVSAEDFEGILTGKLSSQAAFLSGKLKIQGDMMLAMKLQSIFSLG